MEVRFGEAKQYLGKEYDGRHNLNDHLVACQNAWVSNPKEEWVHAFVHTLDEIPRLWYVSIEL